MFPPLGLSFGQDIELDRNARYIRIGRPVSRETGDRPGDRRARRIGGRCGRAWHEIKEWRVGQRERTGFRTGGEG